MLLSRVELVVGLSVVGWCGGGVCAVDCACLWRPGSDESGVVELGVLVCRVELRFAGGSCRSCSGATWCPLTSVLGSQSCFLWGRVVGQSLLLDCRSKCWNCPHQCWPPLAKFPARRGEPSCCHLGCGLVNLVNPRDCLRARPGCVWSQSPHWPPGLD